MALPSINHKHFFIMIMCIYAGIVNRNYISSLNVECNVFCLSCASICACGITHHQSIHRYIIRTIILITDKRVASRGHILCHYHFYSLLSSLLGNPSLPRWGQVEKIRYRGQQFIISRRNWSSRLFQQLYVLSSRKSFWSLIIAKCHLPPNHDNPVNKCVSTVCTFLWCRELIGTVHGYLFYLQ